jgi:hypothetical protein
MKELKSSGGKAPKAPSQARKQILQSLCFGGAFFAWGLLSAALSIYFAPDTIREPLIGFLILWVWCGIDLFVLGKTVARLMALVSSRTPAKNGKVSRGALFWGFLKLLWLGTAIPLMNHVKYLTLTPILLGFGTLVVVPILGGWLSSHWTAPFDEGEDSDQGPNDTTSI